MNRIPKDKSPGRDLRNKNKNWNLEMTIKIKEKKDVNKPKIRKINPQI